MMKKGDSRRDAPRGDAPGMKEAGPQAPGYLTRRKSPPRGSGPQDPAAPGPDPRAAALLSEGEAQEEDLYDNVPL